jgi:hypothetical protein
VRSTIHWSFSVVVQVRAACSVSNRSFIGSCLSVSSNRLNASEHV